MMNPNAHSGQSFETHRDRRAPESANLMDNGQHTRYQLRLSTDARSEHRDFSAPPTPTFHSRQQSGDYSRDSIRSFLSNHPYLHVNQDSFYNTLQDNIRHYSLRSDTAWSQSGTTTPINASRRDINNSSTWGSQMDKSIGSSPNSPSSPYLPGPPTANGGAPAGPPAINFSKQHEILFIANVCLAQLMSLAALAQTISPLLIIADSLGVDHPGELAWFTAAYSMSLGTFIMPAGRLGDMFGHKKIFILGWLWLALWSFLCGFAYNWGYIALCIARGFQGIGPALLVPNGIALIGRSFPPGDKRALVIGCFGACGPCGFLIGAAFSGMFAEVVWWPWAFWATAIAGLFITFISFVIIPDQLAVPAAPPGQKVPTFDWYGAITGVAGLMLINFVLNQAPLAGWGTPYVYFLLIIGIMFTAIFLFIEFTIAKDPLLPMRGLQPQALLTLGCIAAGWASHGVWLYFYYLFEMRLRNHSGTLATLHLLPVGPLGIAWALSTGLLIKRFHVSRVMLAAMLMFCIGTIILTYTPPEQIYWAQTFVSILVMVGGMNLSFPAGTLLLSNSMPREHQGKAASLISTVVNYSIASGLGLAGTVEAGIHELGGDTLRGYQGAWELGIGFSALGVVLSLYFIWTARHQIKDARTGGQGEKGANPYPSSDARSIHGGRKFFRVSQANLAVPAPSWMHRVTSQIFLPGSRHY